MPCTVRTYLLSVAVASYRVAKKRKLFGTSRETRERFVTYIQTECCNQQNSGKSRHTLSGLIDRSMDPRVCLDENPSHRWIRETILCLVKEIGLRIRRSKNFRPVPVAVPEVRRQDKELSELLFMRH